MTSDTHGNIQSVRPFHKPPFWRRVMTRLRLLWRLLKYYRLQKILFDVYFARSILTFTELGIAERLRGEPKRCAELAHALGADAGALDLLLRLQTRLGILVRDRDGRYRLTDLGQYVRSDSPNSLRGSIISMDNLVFPAWENLTHTVKTGKAGFDDTFGVDFYTYIRRQPDTNTCFTQWMAETIREWVLPALDLFDFSQIETIVDVGGNTGLLCAMILQQYPRLCGIVFDQPYLATEAEAFLKSHSVAERCRFEGGDFFQSVARGGDLYIISRVLDNWDDPQALAILKTCRAAMGAASRLLIIDGVVPEKNPNRFDIMANLHVLVMGNGVMRTAREYRTLLKQAGFLPPNIVHTGGTVSFIETALDPEWVTEGEA